MADDEGWFLASHDPGKTVNRRTLGRKTVHFVGHALTQMEVRGIKEHEVFDTLDHPDRTNLPTRKGRKRYRKHRNQKTSIDVVFELNPDMVRIITAIKIDRPREYGGR